MLQPKAGYIDARPLTARSAKFSCNARPDHTFGSFTTETFSTRANQCPLLLQSRHYCSAQRSDAKGRVEMWRGGCRLNISVAASFVWRCLSGSTMAPFPHPAHRTGQADFPHPALGQDFTPLLSRATPSAVSEHSSELIGCPISMSFTTYCVCLELRSLPSTGITRLQRYYEPLRHPRAPGLSLAGVRLVIADHA